MNFFFDRADRGAQSLSRHVPVDNLLGLARLARCLDVIYDEDGQDGEEHPVRTPAKYGMGYLRGQGNFTRESLFRDV
jgi:hypothetical protein